MASGCGDGELAVAGDLAGGSDEALERELDVLRSKDLITDLYNRQHMLTAIEQAASLAANGTKEQALLLIEPDVKRVMGLCDRVTVLDYGKQIAECTPATVQKNEKVIESYLGTGGH